VVDDRNVVLNNYVEDRPLLCSSVAVADDRRPFGPDPPNEHMGFGSYDESEQQNQDLDTDDDSAGVSVRENEHEGDVSFETEESASDLVDRLQDMKDEDEEE
jgi:hypothetical protein